MTLSFGDGSKTNKKDYVILLQKLLTTIGFMPGKIDGEYGNSTASAVAEFQLAYGLNATGILDENTYQTITKVLAGTISRVERPKTKLISTKTAQPSLPIMNQTFLGFSMTTWLIGIGALAGIYLILKSTGGKE